MELIPKTKTQENQTEIKGFSDKGSWFKGNLHCHTTNSDGMLSPKEVVSLYREQGYHFLCLSDHDLYTDYRETLGSEEFILLPGLEASAVLYEKGNQAIRKKVHHIHGILGTSQMQREATKPMFSHMERYEPKAYFGFWDGACVAQELVLDLKDRGCITTYNHPIWSRVREEEFIHTEGIWALEIYNYNTVNESGTGFDSTYWDVMLREGYQILAIATDDNHNEGAFEDSCGGYIMVKSEELSHDCLIENMLRGNYYSSSGPQIFDWGVKGGVAYVTCSGVYRIDFIAGNAVNDGTSIVSSSYEKELTQGTYTLKGHETYVRVQCTDRNGKTAWSNPIYFDTVNVKCK